MTVHNYKKNFANKVKLYVLSRVVLIIVMIQRIQSLGTVSKRYVFSLFMAFTDSLLMTPLTNVRPTCS